MSFETLCRMSSGVVYFSQMAALSYYYRQTKDKAVLHDSTKEPRALVVFRSVWAFAVVASIFSYILFPSWLEWGRMGLGHGLRAVGIALGVGSDLLILWILKYLGRNISAALKVRDNQRLVTDGPYRYVRHPLYSAGILLFIAIALMTSNWFLGAIGIGFQVLVMVVRTPLEEAMLLDHFGDQYRLYMQKTGAFFPKVSFLPVFLFLPRR